MHNRSDTQHMEKEISKATLKRLPTYLSYLKALPEDTSANISATALAAGLHMGEVQVRKDLALVSDGGRPKIGYNREHLIADIEKTHGDRFGYFAELLEKGELYHSQETTFWICLNCGHIHKGTDVPPQCPVCSHGQGYFIPLCLAPYEPVEKEKYQL